GRRGDRQACARPPGAAKGRCDRRRPADQSPESYPRSSRGQANDQERQAPRGPAAATLVAEDRDGQPDPPARPGDPGPFGAAGDTGPCPARSVGTVTAPPAARYLAHLRAHASDGPLYVVLMRS